MKLQKGLSLLATVSLLGLSVACSDRYTEGLEKGKTEGLAQGYDSGYDDGYADGDVAGFERAKAFFASSEYNKGFNDGRAVGTASGYQTGFTAGSASGYNTGFTAGQGDVAGKVRVAYNNGYDNGMADGYDIGYDDGMADGYDMGYDDGMLDGYDLGYDDGYADGFEDGSLSLGKSKALKGYSNLLSMAHNDMFDYSKIASPKVSARGVVANGKLLFEETSLTNKDTLKRAAVIEQYLVVEMAKQVKGKFGLSAERSFKIASAANHFRKFASSRALTNEDTNAYVTEMIGVSLKTIEAAKASGDMSSVLEAAASKNGTTAEKMAEILAKNFI